MGHSRINTIRNRLFASSVVITGVAVAIIYLYVVPQLESSLTAERLDGIEQSTAGQVELAEEVLRSNPGPERLENLVGGASDATGSRVTLIAVERFEGPGEGPPSLTVREDSASRESLSTGSAEIAAEAAAGRLARGTGVGTSGRRAEVAYPVGAEANGPRWVMTFSEPLREIEQNVSRIGRQILIAAAIALALAIITGFVASRYLARRLRQLADAARRLAAGDFAIQVPPGPPDELGEVARAFNEMRSRLSDLDRARRQFIANASHELRTPIFSLGGFIELLDEGDLDEETRAEFIASMHDQVERLTKLTTDLLDLSKLDSGALTFRPRPVDVSGLAREIAEELGPRADAHGSRLEVRTPASPPVTVADPDRVRQIIRILLDNAITHTPPGTKVTVTSECQGARVTVTVFDQGPGIPKPVQSHMFDRFYTAAESGGSGLGLPIAQALALRMNGQVTFSSHKGRTSFTLDLPQAPSAGAGPEQTAGSRPSFAGRAEAAERPHGEYPEAPR